MRRTPARRWAVGSSCLLWQPRWQSPPPFFFSVLAKKDIQETKTKWADPTYQRFFLEKIAASLGVKKLDDWYKVSRKEVTRRGGKGLFSQYGSLAQALRSIFPEQPWDDQRFVREGGRAPPGWWQDKNNLLSALSAAEERLGITKPEDWYSVTLADLKTGGFPTKVGKMRFVQLLGEKYPNHQWEKVYLLKGKYAQQHRLERAVFDLFQGLEIKTNVRKEVGLINPDTRDYLELDVYIPSLQLAFEYQERHHYISSQFIYQPLNTFQTRDSIKQVLSSKKGITLILVPFWWDGKQESLAATLLSKRPDLQSLIATATPTEPIPEEAPPGYMEKFSSNIEDIGQPVSACFFNRMNVDPKKWWMFEKYDGVRGFWNPSKKTFYSRLGKKFSLPSEIVNSMPDDLFLDGELWFGRDSFQEAMKIANRTDPTHIDWTKFKYMVYDIPNHKGPYESRYNELEERLGKTCHPYIQVAPKVECRDMDHLEMYFHNVIDIGGEGIILRDPYSLYEPGRSAGFLKHKKFRDAEARIVRSVGPHQWECELPNSTLFVAPAGTTEFVKRYNPQPGDIVSFKHHGYLLASKKPKFPTLYRLRTDLTWEDVTRNWTEQKSIPSALPMRRPTKKHANKGHWVDLSNARRFFLEFAAERGFDPTSAENWNGITRKDIYTKRGGMSILKNYNCSLSRALRTLFPEMNKELRVEKKPKDYWRDAKNCRAFFDDYAKEQGFNPLDPDTSWYTMNLKKLFIKMGARGLSEEYGGLKKALQVAYPEVQFTRWQTHAA